MRRRNEASSSARAAKRTACREKTRYASGKVAVREAERFGMDFYACLECGGWHLTRSGSMASTDPA